MIAMVKFKTDEIVDFRVKERGRKWLIEREK